ncbi:MAG: 50S ribosomal protein L13 [Thermales bacterium]|nr:50S ribosomal protein L13 [Thermales bacterium]
MSQSIRNTTKTMRPSKQGYQRDWYVLDASKEPMGRLATKAANILMGKNRADYSPDVNMGGIVVIINSKKTKVTGQKAIRKNYFRHSGRLGGLKIRSFQEQMTIDPSVPIYKAIKICFQKPSPRH